MNSKKLLKNISWVTALPCVALLSNCSSLVSKSDYPVSFMAENNPIQVQVKNGVGEVVHSGVTPTTVTLSASSGYFKRAKYTVMSSNGNQQEMKAKLDPWYMGNAVVSPVGIIGALAVDPVTGSMWQLDNVFVVK